MTLAQISQRFQNARTQQGLPTRVSPRQSDTTTTTAVTTTMASTSKRLPDIPQACRPQLKQGQESEGMVTPECHTNKSQTPQKETFKIPLNSSAQPHGTEPLPSSSSSFSVAALLAGVRSVRLIEDGELDLHSSGRDCELSRFWAADFASITMTPSFWATVDDWD